MPNLAIVVKVMPDDMTHFEHIKKEIREKFKPARMDEEDVAFGIKALKVTFLVDDAAGSQGLEEKLAAIKGVSYAEISEMGRY